MLEPMKTMPPNNTPIKISVPSLLGFLDNFSCTECFAGGANGGAAAAPEVAPVVGTDTGAMELLSMRKIGQLGTPQRVGEGWVIREFCYGGSEVTSKSLIRAW